jgi:O-antigen/teichoic acid export membrane protein
VAPLAVEVPAAGGGRRPAGAAREAAVPLPGLSLRLGVSWSLVGNAVYLGCQYGMLMAIAKLGSPVLVGRFALAQAITAPVILFSQMQLRQVQVTDVSASARFADYFWTRVACTVLAVAAILAFVSATRLDGATAVVVALVAVAKGFESVSDIAYGKLQSRERMDLVAYSLVAKGVLSLATLTLLLWLTGSLEWAVAGLAGVWGLLLFAYDLPVRARLGGEADPVLARLRPAVMKRLALTALPLAAFSGLTALSGNLPRYFLEAMHGNEAVAIYSVAAAPLMLAALLSGSMTQAALPRAAQLFQSRQLGALRRLTLRLTLLQLAAGAALVAGLALFGGPLVSLLFTPEYRPAVPVMVTLAAGIAVAALATHGSMVLMAGRRFGLQLVNIVVAVVVQVPLCYLLIRPLGAEGAGWSEVARLAASTAFLAAMGAVVYRAQSAGAGAAVPAFGGRREGSPR